MHRDRYQVSVVVVVVVVVIKGMGRTILEWWCDYLRRY